MLGDKKGNPEAQGSMPRRAIKKKRSLKGSCKRHISKPGFGGGETGSPATRSRVKGSVPKRQRGNMAVGFC